MGFLITTLVVLAVSTVSGLWFGRWWRQDRIERLREQARLTVIETQMAAMRAALRIQAAEHLARRSMRAEAEHWQGQDGGWSS